MGLGEGGEDGVVGGEGGGIVLVLFHFFFFFFFFFFGSLAKLILHSERPDCASRSRLTFGDGKQSGVRVRLGLE